MILLLRIARRLVLIIETINHWLASATALIPIMMTILVTVNVLLRYVFRNPISFEYETVQVMLLGSLWLPQAYIFSKEKALKVELFFSKLSFKAQTIIKIFNNIIGIFYFAMITIACWKMAIYSFEIGSRSVHLSRFPMGPQQLLVVIGSGLLCLILFLRIAHNVVSLVDTKYKQR